VKTNLTNQTAGERLDIIIKELNLQKKDFAEKIGVTTGYISNIINQKRMLSPEIICKLLDIGVSPIFIFYGVGKPVDSNYQLFLENYKVDEEEIPQYLQEYILINLKRKHKLERKFINLFFPTSEFITRHLTNVDKGAVTNITISNAKHKLINFIKQVKLNKILDSESKRKKVIEEIKNDFANVEIYVLLKNYKLFSSLSQE